MNKFIEHAISEKNIIILYLSHWKISNETEIAKNLEEYLKSINVSDKAKRLTNIDDLVKSYNYYKNKNKYILLTVDKILIDNWSEQVSCFEDQTLINHIPFPCSKITCNNKDSMV
jgi:hypothetical protein